MKPNVELAVQVATLISVIIGFVGLWATLRVYHRQLEATVFLSLTARYEAIMSKIPRDAWAARFDESKLPKQSENLTLSALRYLNLCSEEFYLYKNKLVSKKLWCAWEEDMKRLLASPLFKREWITLKEEFGTNGEFQKFVEAAQQSVKP